MTATAGDRAKTVDWNLWVPGVATPVACFLVDFAAGEYLLRIVPAALLSLAAIGIASLVLSRNRQRTAARLAAVGPMWIVGGSTLALGAPLAAISGIGLLFSFVLMWRHPEALLIIAWALLGLTPLWTGITYLREARALTKDQAELHGSLKTGLFALAGAIAAISIVIAAQVIDIRFIKAQVAALDSHVSEAWQSALHSLNTYPLCGRYRCRRFVCEHLRGQFPLTRSGNPDVPTPLDDVFLQTFGERATEGCWRYVD